MTEVSCAVPPPRSFHKKHWFDGKFLLLNKQFIEQHKLVCLKSKQMDRIVVAVHSAPLDLGM
jgi:hypothetical protein